MLKVGLTGGIGCGKSVVAGMFGELGAHVIDADGLARRELMPGRAAYDETVRIFGEGILAPGGGIDRAALADIVFTDPERRRLLEAVVHPGVFGAEAELTARIQREDPAAVVLFEAALLIETSAHERMDRVGVVWCRPETQYRRVMRKFGLSREAAGLRIAAQMPLDEKKKYATHLVDNDNDLEYARAQVERLYGEFRR